MNYESADIRRIDIQNPKISPGYWVVAIFFLIGGSASVVRYGWLQAIPLFVLAFVLPLTSYVIRGRNPRWIELDARRNTISQGFELFGRKTRKELDIRQFKDVNIKLINTQYPKVHLVLVPIDKSQPEFLVAWADVVSDRDMKIIPKGVAPESLLKLQLSIEKMLSGDGKLFIK